MVKSRGGIMATFWRNYRGLPWEGGRSKKRSKKVQKKVQKKFKKSSKKRSNKSSNDSIAEYCIMAEV
jgi:hypothetical protein